ncbi:MAG: tyrosine-type recombinase/integrase [Acidimicrobiia bacterium]
MPAGPQWAAHLGSAGSRHRTSGRGASDPHHHQQRREDRHHPPGTTTARSIDMCVGERGQGPILLNREANARLDRHAATRIVKRLARQAGIPKKISPHSLRHSFITAALDAGVALCDAQEAASHADPRTTMR